MTYIQGELIEFPQTEFAFIHKLAHW